MKKFNVTVGGGAGNDAVNHSAISATSIARANNGREEAGSIVRDVVITFTDSPKVNANKSIIPGEGRNDPDREVIVVSAAKCGVTGFDKPQTVNITRVINVMTSGSTYGECIQELFDIIGEEDGDGIIADIEFMDTFRTWRFTNIRVHTV